MVHTGDRHAHDEGRERDIFDAFKLRRLHDDARCARAGHKSLRRQAHAQAAVRLADVVRIANNAHMKFVHGRRTEDFRVAERDQLRSPDGQCVETGDAGAALLAGIRVVQPVIIEEIVAGELSPARVGVDPSRRFVISYGFRISRASKIDPRRYWAWDVLQQGQRGRRPRAHRNHGVGKTHC